MRKFVLVLIFVWSNLHCIGQFIPNSSQNFQFAPLYNPAFTGIEGFRDVKLGYRYQWTGFGSEAPKFINASFNFRLKEPLDLTLNALRTSMEKTQNTEIPKMKRDYSWVRREYFSGAIWINQKARRGRQLFISLSNYKTNAAGLGSRRHDRKYQN